MINLNIALKQDLQLVPNKDEKKHALSKQDITLEQIKQHTNTIMELIYV